MYMKDFLMPDLWRKFKLAKLSQIMRQKNDTMFMELLNDIRAALFDDTIDYTLKSRIKQQSDGQSPIMHCIFLQKMIQQMDIMNLC